MSDDGASKENLHFDGQSKSKHTNFFRICNFNIHVKRVVFFLFLHSFFFL